MTLFFDSVLVSIFLCFGIFLPLFFTQKKLTAFALPGMTFCAVEFQLLAIDVAIYCSLLFFLRTELYNLLFNQFKLFMI